ncbi:uncharacterized protein BDV17DRAFT_177867 [Aspergillus undulatus]|uniref:uncharacterized protein n=1 Tax=Aspergillus undulatus TaxID=1810928 RepID=UPI003CCD13E1
MAPIGGAGPATDVAHLLGGRNIPYVLWGWMAIALYGYHEVIPEVDFVIPDAWIPYATELLANSGFPHCEDPDCVESRAIDRFWADDAPLSRRKCHTSLARDRYHPIAAAHFHIDQRYQFHKILSLHKQSSVLWWLPDIKPERPAADDPVMSLTTSDQTVSGSAVGRSRRWVDEYPVRILTPWVCTRAVMILFCRDFGHIKDLDLVWQNMLYALMGNRDAEIERRLEPHFRDAWGLWHGDKLRGRNPWLGFCKLRTILLENGELGSLPEVDISRRI